MATTLPTVTTAKAVSDPNPRVTRLYRHDCKYECCPSRWSEYDAVSDEQLALESKILSEPIVHRHCFNNDDRKWVTTSFIVNSLAMCSILSKVLHKYQGLDIYLLNWTFSPPFMPLVSERRGFWPEASTVRKKSLETTRTIDL